MTTVLAKIGDHTQQRIDILKAQRSLDQLKNQLSFVANRSHDFKKVFLDDGVNIIAEYKRASPSQGDIAPHLSPLAVATDYLGAGAKALSVLTEPTYFKGDIQFIHEIRRKFPEANLLMKDFFVDEYQLYQALEAGADAILIIVGLLGPEKAKLLHEKARSLGLCTLVEVHNRQELDVALGLDPDILGVNNRDLRDLSISLQTSLDLAQYIPKEQIAISESGIATAADIQSLQDAGYRGFLIGTSLMATGEPGRALSGLLGDGG